MAMPASNPEGNIEQILRSVSPVPSSTTFRSGPGNNLTSRPSLIEVIPEVEPGTVLSPDEFDIPVLSVKPSHTWDAPKKSFEWFKQIADCELSDADLETFLKDFIPSNDISKHFEPPKLPNAIWSRIKAQTFSSDEYLKQRSIMKSQRLQTGVIMPLLSVLETMRPSDPNQKLVASAIQMLCSSNLQLIRFRRTSVAKFVKSDIRQPLFSQPVSHLHMFGADENESAEKVLKTQATSFNKVLTNPPITKLRHFKPNHLSQNVILPSSDAPSHSFNAPAGSSRGYVQSNTRPSTSRSALQPQLAMSGSKIVNQNHSQQPFRASYRGRGRSGRYRAFRRGGNHSYH